MAAAVTNHDHVHRKAGKTTVTVQWLPFDSDADERGVFDKSHDSMRGGWGGTLDRLGGIFRGRRAQLMSVPPRKFVLTTSPFVGSPFRTSSR